MTKNELGKLNYNILTTFKVFKQEKNDIPAWEDLTAEEQENWIAAALEVNLQVMDPEVTISKRAADLKIGEKIFGPLSWMNGPEEIVDLDLSHDLKVVNVHTMGEYGRYSTEYHELEAIVEVAA